MLRNSTKFFLLTAILFFSLNSDAQSLNQEQLKGRLDSLWQSPSYLKHQGLTKKDLKKIPKYDRPDLAVEQDCYMTIDPNTLTVPSETKYGIMQMVDSINNASFGYAAISGVTWYERGPDNFGGRTRAIMFDPTDSANGYKKAWAGGVAGGLWYNGDITSTTTAWSKVDDFWANMAITSMAYDPTDDSTFYVGTGEGWYNADAVRGQGVWKSTDAGQTWSQLSSTTGSAYYYIQKLVVTPTGRIVVATRSNIRYSDNGGTSWSSAASGVFADIEVSANGDLYASKGNVFTSGDILKSTNNGTSWSSILPSGAGTIRRVELACAPSDSNILYAVAGNTSYNVAWMKKSINAGSTWTDLAIPRYLNDTSVHFTRGQSWYDLILAVHPTNPAIVLAGGIDVHRTADSGATWTGVSHWYGGFSKPEVHADQHAMAFRPGANNAALFGNDGGTYYSSNVGSSSSPSFTHSVKGYNVTQFYSVALKDSLGSNYMLAGAQDNGSHQFTTAGINSTTEVTGGDGAFCFIDQDNPSYQITSYVRNNWRRSTNGGISFSNITSNSSGRFINPADYDDAANILYAAAGNNQVYRVSGIASTSSVTTSTLTVGGSALGGVQASHLRCSPYSSHTLFVGTSSGGVYKVTGANSSPTSVDIDPNSDLPSGYISCIEVGASDSQLLITYTNYGVNSVWETQNAGTSWQSKEGDLPNMPIRWALYNPNDRTQAMLATEVGVWTTDDLGATSVDWEPSNNGLANVRCDMLQIRASDNEVAIATHARGVFTTNIFGDTSIKASFTASSDEICLGNSVIFTNTGTGNISNNTWTFTPSTVTFISGTDSSSTTPVVQFNAAGQYTVKLRSADASASDVDSFTVTNAVTAQSGRAFGNWTQNFDTITAAPASYVDSIWSLDYGTTYLWKIDSNGTPSSNSGPASDFGGFGHYLYAEASNPAIAGDLAYLQTGCITMPDTGYFKFGFHMYGSTMGTLGVDADTGTGWYSQGLIAGEQHTADTSDWGEAILDLGVFNGAIARLRISALRGSSYYSDIAIDELRFQDRLYGCDTFVAATCVPTTSNTTYDDGVYGVKIGAVEYTSSGVSTDGEYTERVCTDTFTVSDRGFRLYVDAGNSISNRVRAYIDYNNDGQFDTTNEMVWYSSKIVGYRSDSITVPTTGVVNGSYLRMRIMADDNSNIPNNPCGIMSYGESEDFSVKIENDRCEIVGFSLGNDTTQCGGSVSLSAGTYTSYVWSTGAASSNISVNATGTYSVLATDASGCTGLDTMEVVINSLPSVNLGNDTIQCGGNVTLSAGSHVGYSWSTGSVASSISVANSGTYSVTVTDTNGCEDSDDVLISIGLPSVDLGNDTAQCGGAVNLSADNFTSYLWSTGSTSSSISAANSGTYSIIVTDSNGCTDTDDVDVTINSLPSVNLGFDKEQCAGTVDLDAGNFTSYSWSTGSITGTINVVSTGTYTVTVVDSNGCSNSDTINITIHSLPEVDLGNDTTLCGGNLTLVGGTITSQSYAWTTGFITSSIVVSSSGLYSVTVTDANGCDQTDDIEVTIHTPETDFLPTAADMCAGDMLDAGTGSSYVWSSGATSQSIAVSSSIIYSVTKLDTNGCSVSDAVNVTIIPLPIAEFSFSIYNKTSTTFRTDFINISSNQDSVHWDFGNGSTNDLNSPSANFNTGSYEVTLIVINDCGEDTIIKTVAFIAGVNEELFGDIKVFPNPSSDFLMIVSEGDLNLDKVKLFDVYGKEVISWSSDIKTNQEVKLNTSELASGTYYVTIISGEIKIVRRVIVTR